MKKAKFLLNDYLKNRHFEGDVSYKQGDIVEVYNLEEVIEKCPKGEDFFRLLMTDGNQAIKPIGFIYIDDYVTFEPVYEGWIDFNYAD